MAMTSAMPRTAAMSAAVALAEEEARQLGHRRVGSEHLLLAVLATGDGNATILRTLHLELPTVRAAVADLMPGTSRPVEGELPLTDSALGAIQRAEAAARRLGSPAVHTDHLLLGIAQQHEGIGSRVLTELGATAEKVRGLVEREAAARQAAPCPQCGAALDPAWRFCPLCGTARAGTG
jgi:ATP-dependent Clp protease ATP-binding subunit ClpC